MDTNKVKYTDETLNLRSFYLRLLKKIWILPVAALIGAILAGGIYYLVTVTFGPDSYSDPKKERGLCRRVREHRRRY